MKKGILFILTLLMLFTVKSYSQSFSNVDTINAVLSASSFKTITLATGVKCITVDNSGQTLDLKVGFSPHGSTVDTSNTYTVPAGEIWSFPDRLNNYLYLKSGAAATIRLIIDYGAGIPYYKQNISLGSISYKDTLSAGTVSKTYNFARQYPHVWVSQKYDSASAGKDTLRIYQIGAGGDTTDVYVLDSANNRIGYIVNTGDKVFKKWRLDVLCPNILIFKYSDAVIYTTKWIILPEGVKY